MTHEERYRNGLNQPYMDGRSNDRHEGIFSAGNIYYQQMQRATKKQDIDALYELAVKEEARLAQLANDRDYSESIRDEQRDYDSPLQRVARDKVAGINSDLAGGSAGSSGSSGSSGAISNSVPSSQPVQGQTKFSNMYDNINSFSNVVSSVGGFISSLAGGYGTIVNSLSQLKMLPSQLRMANVSADVAERTADNVVEQSSLGVKQMNLDILSQNIEQVGQLSGLINADTSDEDALSLLTGLGYSADEAPNKLRLVREYQGNPSWQAFNENAKKIANDNRAFNEQYTPAFLSRMYAVQKMAERNALDLQIKKQNYDKLFQDYLYTEDYARLAAQDVREGTLASISSSQTSRDNDITQRKSNQLVRGELEQSITALENHIGILAKEYQSVTALIHKYRKKLYSGVTLNAYEQSMLDALELYQHTILTTGQENMDILHDGMRTFKRQRYLFEESMRVNDNGDYELNVWNPFLSFYRNYGNSFFIDQCTGDSSLSYGDGIKTALEVGVKVATKGKAPTTSVTRNITNVTYN